MYPSKVDQQFEGTKWALLGGYRFVLASLVVYVHLGWMIAPMKAVYVPLSAVLCFLIISGYSIAASLERSTIGFYRRRFARIYPVYFFSLLITLAALVIARTKGLSLDFNQSDPLAVLGSFLMLQGLLTPIWALIGPSWTLSLEVLCYAFAPVLNRLALRWLIAIWSLSSIVYVAHAYATGDNYNHAEYGLAIAGLVWAWISGFLFYRFRDSNLARTLLLIGTPMVYLTFIWQDGRLGVALVLITVMLLASTASRSLPSRSIRVLEYLGDLSYPLYICHYPLYFLYGAVIAKPQEAFGHPSLAGYLGAVSIVTVVTFHLIDRPIRIWILKRWQSQVA